MLDRHLHGPGPAALRAEPVPRWLWIVGVVGLALFGAVQRWVFEGEWGFPLDDSWIHLEFARHLALGEGMSYEPGELVPGSTAPLWTSLVSIGFLLPGAAAMWSQVGGAVFYLLTVATTYRLSRDLDLSPGLSSLAAGATALTGWMVWSGLSGLEIPLFCWLSLQGIRSHLREREVPSRVPRSWVYFAVASLARPEGLLLLLLAMVERWAVPAPTAGRDGLGRSTLIAVGAVAVILVPVAAFHLAAVGSLLPTTFAVKTSGSAGVAFSMDRLKVLVSILFEAQPLAVVGAGAGVWALLSRLGARRDRGVLIAAWVFGLPLAYSMLSSSGGSVLAGNFGRYLFPLFPPLCVLAAVGLEPVAHFLSERSPSRRRLAVVAAAALWLLPPAASLVRGVEVYATNLTNVRDSEIAMADWLRENVPSEAVLAVNDIGVYGYELPNRVLDLAGIVHPSLNRLRNEAVTAGRPAMHGVYRFLDDHRPDYLVIFPNWFPALANDPEFPVVHEIVISGNITMGGDRLTVFETPWTRFPSRGPK